jgi:hypothetical protein
MWFLTALLAFLVSSIVPSLASGNVDLQIRQQPDPYFVNGDFSEPLIGTWSVSPKHDGK